MDPWDGLSPRACTPPPALVTHHSVYAATPTLAQTSPLPLALGLYLSAGGVSRPRPLPLFYVPPPAAAQLRLPPGWYAAAPPTGSLSLRLTRVPAALPCGTDLLMAHLSVDGVPVNCPEAFHADAPLGEERVVHGFVEAFVADGPRMTRVVNRFQLGKTVVGEGAGDVGTVTLSVAVGKAVPVDRGPAMGGYVYAAKGGVKESDLYKDGRSVSVQGGETIAVEGWAADWEVAGETPVGEVVVRLRQASWLKAKGVLDADGVPFNGSAASHRPAPAPAQKKEDKVEARVSRVAVIDVDRPAYVDLDRPHIRTLPPVVELDKDVIDLT